MKASASILAKICSLIWKAFLKNGSTKPWQIRRFANKLSRCSNNTLAIANFLRRSIAPHSIPMAFRSPENHRTIKLQKVLALAQSRHPIRLQILRVLRSPIPRVNLARAKIGSNHPKKPPAFHLIAHASTKINQVKYPAMLLRPMNPRKMRCAILREIRLALPQAINRCPVDRMPSVSKHYKNSSRN